MDIGWVMIFYGGSNISFWINLYDPDAGDNIAIVDLYEDGVVIDSIYPDTTSITWQPTINTNLGKHYYFVYAKQTDGNILISSPIWYNAIGTPTIDIILNDSEFTICQTLTITARVTNNSNPVDVDGKIWIRLPDDLLFSIINLYGATLPANFNWSKEIFTHHFTGGEPQGVYEVGGRLLNSITGDFIWTDIEYFSFTP
jgi:hypothetical protein